MSSAEQSLAFFMLISAVPTVGLATYAYQNRTQPGVHGFLLCLIGMVGWSVQLASVTWPTQFLPVHLNVALRYLFQLLVIFGWPLLVWEYSNQKRLVPRRVHIAALSFVPIVTLALMVTNPWHYLVLAAETPTDPAGISEYVLGPWYLVHIGFAVTVVMLPVGTLLSDLRDAHGTHRKQILLLLVGWLFGFPGALNTHLLRNIEAIPTYVDLTPLTFILTAGLWGTALFRYQLFSMLPVSRRTAVETMPDPVISVDSNDIVVDANPAAQQLFGTDRAVGGISLEAFCAAYPEILSLYESGAERAAEVSLDTEVGPRHFSVYSRPIQQGGSVTGSLLVLREVTELREREQELELLKQVLSRVFRHNMRNRLNVIEGHLREMTADDDVDTEHTTIIFETIEQLLSHSDKAVDMQQIIDTDTADSHVSLGAVARHEVAALTETHPEITIHGSIADVTVRCHPAIEKAVQELLENAVSHAEGSLTELRLRLTVTHTDGQGRLVIADNGPGIPAHEIEALNAGEETDLEHGSGVGLWLVRLLVQRSGGTLSIGNDSEVGGTRVELTLPAPAALQAHDDTKQTA